MKPKAREGGEAGEANFLVLSHCILNSATRWWQNGSPVEKNKGPVDEVLEFLSARSIGAVQLQCPEFTFCGNPRPPRTKDEYENLPGFQLHCERLAEKSAQHLKTLVVMGRKPRTRLLAIVGVERSPTCGVKCTPHTVDGKVEYVKEKGLFIGLLEEGLEKLGLKIPIIGIDLQKPAESYLKLNELLEQ
jgi:predicted secreted protein